MIEFTKGNLFKKPSECLVNPVNCEGIMGKGLALEFKERFKNNYKLYKQLCEKKELIPGKLAIIKVEIEEHKSIKYIVNFPTKNRFKNPSKYEYIEKGLLSLDKHIPMMGIRSISIPALGCGLGKLEWKKVKKMILEQFSKYKNDPKFKILVFEPGEK